ncbi:MAG: hypothetical protein IJ729_04980 [Alloprevotella sp.]|nr:hypothetical protein [Alloprevotella sp.]
MKKTSTLLLLLAAGTLAASAQQPDGGDDSKRKQRMERRAVEQAKQMQLDDATTLWFSNLYIEYQTELDHIRREARAGMPRPKGKPGDTPSADEMQVKSGEMKKLTDEEAEKFILARITMERKEAELKAAYYPRFREKLQPKQLMRIFAPAPRGQQGQRGQQGFGGPFGPGFRPGGGPGGPGF